MFARPEQLQPLRDADFTIEDDPRPQAPPDEILAADRLIHGHVFHAGTKVEYWLDPPFDEMTVTLATPHVVVGLSLPARTNILFDEQGKILCCVTQVPHGKFAAGTRIAFEHGAWQLDQAETSDDYLDGE